MRHEAFQIGLEFECGGQRWRCTDLGTRTVIAIALEYPEDPSWYNGPPYAVAEAVFDDKTNYLEFPMGERRRTAGCRAGQR